MLGRMVRFDFGVAREAEDILMTALTMRVQRTHRREHRSTRRPHEDIVAKILHAGAYPSDLAGFLLQDVEA